MVSQLRVMTGIIVQSLVESSTTGAREKTLSENALNINILNGLSNVLININLPLTPP